MFSIFWKGCYMQKNSTRTYLKVKQVKKKITTHFSVEIIFNSKIYWTKHVHIEIYNQSTIKKKCQDIGNEGRQYLVVSFSYISFFFS